LADNNIFFAGTTNKEIIIFDRRRGTAAIIQNDALINALYVYRDGGSILSGDSNGHVKTWDVLNMSHITMSETAEVGGKPVSHLHVTPPPNHGEEGRFLVVNSYDNCMHCYTV
jgi:WD40 repeat protein